MPAALIAYSVEPPLALVTLKNPPANCYSYEMMRELDEAVLAARIDERVHALVLRGDGERFFCAGADIAMLKSATPQFKYYFCMHANETLNRLEQTPKLSIAALNGHCVGGGLEIALACDLRVAKKDAGKIGLPEVNLGVLPGTGGSQRLLRIAGKARALEWMVEGKVASFEEGMDLGLVHQVWEGDDFWTRVLEYARGFCPPKRAAKAVGFIKRSVQSGGEVGLHEGLALERELQQQLFVSEDASEGIAAYIEKRQARFKGK